MRQTERNRLIERMAGLADERVKVCREAAERYEREEKSDMAATERCAMFEANYLAAQIRLLKTPE